MYKMYQPRFFFAISQYIYRHVFKNIGQIIRMTADKIITPEMIPPYWRQFTPINDICVVPFGKSRFESSRIIHKWNKAIFIYQCFVDFIKQSLVYSKKNANLENIYFWVMDNYTGYNKILQGWFRSIIKTWIINIRSYPYFSNHTESSMDNYGITVPWIIQHGYSRFFVRWWIQNNVFYSRKIS